MIANTVIWMDYEFMPAEKIIHSAVDSDPSDAFVWWQDLPFDTPRIIFGAIARAFYTDAEEGIRIRHVESFGRYLTSLEEKDLPDLGVLPEHVRAITSFLSAYGITAVVEMTATEPPQSQAETPNPRLVSNT